ncbi:MAG: acyl-CoA dehydratase activase [Acidaminococcales bacterium]|jgi:predicted CoA-substrate-specific enzyme activase|nr:acyl-CoA dehydratase activase [Acidaminococcales bacterium]
MFTLGIDIGSTACKAVILQDGARVEARAVVPLGTGTSGAGDVLQKVLAVKNRQIEDMERILVTGYGRFTFAGADSQKSELSCHARGVNFLFPSVRTIIDIGGQDIKAMRVNAKGFLENFVMNDKCAAGTGKFLDVMARIINVKVNDLGEIGLKATEEVNISNTCTVFAESEVISKLSAAVRIEDLVAGIHRSVAKRVASLAFRNGIVPEVAMSGGVALNKGVVALLEEEIKRNILVHEDCQLAGALGAAVLAYEELHK